MKKNILPTFQTPSCDISDFLDWLKKYAPKYPEIQKIFLFGSFARGDASAVSDIDLAFSLSNISEWGVVAHEIRDDARTLRKLDMVCLGKISEDFRKKILDEGLVIYDRHKNHTKSQKL